MARRDLAAVNDGGRARLELEFEQPYLLGPLFGDYDRHLITIEQRLDVHIAARGNKVQIEGEADAAARARDVLIGLYNRLDSGHDVDAEAVEAVLGMAAQPHLDGIITEEVTSAPTGKFFVTFALTQGDLEKVVAAAKDGGVWLAADPTAVTP